MMKYIFMLLMLVAGPVMAAENCIKPKMDYTRDCAEVSNLHNLPVLAKVNDCAELKIDARSHWNASGLRLEKGQEYMLEIKENDQWCDAGVVTNYKGWDVSKNGKLPGSAGCPENRECSKCKTKEAVNGPAVNLGGLKNSFVKMTKWFRRKPDSRLFTLVGVVKGEFKTSKPFEIENQRTIPAGAEGEFCAYANDLSLMYGNNSGVLTLKIKRVK